MKIFSLAVGALLLANVATNPLSGYATYYTVESCRSEGTSGIYTASGQRYDESRLTCALPHRRYGGWYLVTSRSTGKSVRVVHNDYGPGRKARSRGVVIDLTPAAFSELGHELAEGRCQVTVEKLS